MKTKHKAKNNSLLKNKRYKSIITKKKQAETVSSTAFSFAFKSLLLNPAIGLCFPSKSAIYYCLVYLKVLFSFKPSQKALAYVLTVKHSRF